MALERKGALRETCELGIVSTLWEKSGFGRLPVFFAQKRRKPSFLLQHPVSEATAKMPSANTAAGNAEGSSPRVALACRENRWSQTRQGDREDKVLLLPQQMPLMGARSASMPAFSGRDLPCHPTSTARGPQDDLWAQHRRGAGVPKA